MKNTKNLLPIFQSIAKLASISEDQVSILAKIGITRIIDLLFYLPMSIIERKLCNSIQDLKLKKNCIIKAKVLYHRQTKKTLEIICEDIQGNPFSVLYFNYFSKYIINCYKLNTLITITGTADIFNNKLCMIHPEKVYTNPKVEIPIIEVKYRRHRSLGSEFFKKIIQEACLILDNIDINEIYDNYEINDLLNLETISLKEALLNIHNPKNIGDISKDSKYIKKLAFGELIAFHLGVLLQRDKVKKNSSTVIKPNYDLEKQYKKLLPYEFTLSQNQALNKIIAMFNKKLQDTVLLQGDVGSGKTVVCIAAALHAVANNFQVAFMAPTEILATQHYETFKSYSQKLGLNIGLLKAKDKLKNKNEIIKNLEVGKIHIIFGTHALFQEKIKFENLGLCIIDEQHRFGVNQRTSLSKKGKFPKNILTTATPIPRSLTLSLYGDIENILIKEKPHNRKDIITTLKSISKLYELLLSVEKLLVNNKKCFWVCPLIEESEVIKYTAVIDRYNSLVDKFPEHKNKIYLLHGKLSAQEKEEVILKFKNSNVGGILVSTTIIEVGVDIPSCNIMIIENSEHFGLAQLHQLRGRVGRSNEQGYCILLYGTMLGKTAINRLKIIKKSNDGFYLAKEDLKIRGTGNIISTQQSGYDYFKIFSIDKNIHFTIPAIELAKKLYLQIKTKNTTYDSIINFLALYNIDYDKNYIKTG